MPETLEKWTPQRIRALMMGLGYTGRDAEARLALRVHVSIDAVRDWLKRDRFIKQATQRRLARLERMVAAKASTITEEPE